MTSKRKAKKEAKKKGLPMPVTASQMANKVNQKPTEEHKPAEAAVAKAKTKKEPVKREIIGFGQAENGSVVHAITNRENSILCDTRRKNYVVDITKTVQHVSCTKCKSFKMLKDLLEKETVKTVQQKPEPTVEDTTEKPPEKVKVIEFKPKKEVDDSIDPSSDLEILKKYIAGRLVKIRKDLFTFVKETIKNEMNNKSAWFIVRKPNARFQIVHRASRYVFTDNVTQDQAEELILRYSALPIQWDGVSKIPGSFVIAIKQILDEVLAKEKQKEEGKKPRLKRRKKIKKAKVRKPITKKPKKRRTIIKK